MADTSLWQGIVDAVVSHAAASGHFRKVQGHEPKNAPGRDLTCAVWVQGVRTSRSSGLAGVAVTLTLTVRLYSPMLEDPQDAIDPRLLRALDELCEAYAGDFTLGGRVRNVDLFGGEGQPLGATAGYLSQDNRTFRIYDVTLPMVINDRWEESP